jgi:hypothetical protein
MGLELVDWTNLAQDGVQLSSFLKTAMSSLVIS